MADLLKALWGKLYAWALPSALILGTFWLVALPKELGFPGLLSGSGATAFAIGVSAIAFALNAFSRRFYRVLEGYLFWPSWLQNAAVRAQLKRKGRLRAVEPALGWRYGLALEQLALYPKDDDQVVPTRFGNSIRAFELYGQTRYNLDSQTLWYELYTACPEKLQDEYLFSKSSVDFFIAAFYLSIFFGIIGLLLFSLDVRRLADLAFFGAMALLGLSSLWLAVGATAEWAATVQAIVNVGRVALAAALGLSLPASLEDEKVMWGLVAQYGLYYGDDQGKALDRFRAPAREVGSGRLPAGSKAERQVPDGQDPDS